jgi:putative ABC transport system permease protein
MFGIIVGVSSVVIIVSLGEGVRQQITSQAGNVGDSLIVVRPGKKTEARAISFDSLRNFTNGAGSLSETDWKDTEKVEGVELVVPIGSISGIATYNKNEYSGTIIASTEDLPSFINQDVEYGEFFSDTDSKTNVAIIGRDVAERLFEETVPIGKKLTIRGVDYIVQGIFEQQNSGTFAALNINSSIILPYESASDISDNIQILQLYVQADSPENVSTTAENIRQTLITNHAGQEDFTVLEKDEALEATNEIFYQLTVFIAGVAFISFIVGGIGIMNIMFATVSERTHEIGIRKAVGATNQQILGQFIMEAVVLSLVGGMLGIIVALLANGVIRVTTDLQPVTTPSVAIFVFCLSAATGIISGLLPAAQAARKDAINALRNGQ